MGVARKENLAPSILGFVTVKVRVSPSHRERGGIVPRGYESAIVNLLNMSVWAESRPQEYKKNLFDTQDSFFASKICGFDLYYLWLRKGEDSCSPDT
jgi:hypothetical protein